MENVFWGPETHDSGFVRCISGLCFLFKSKTPCALYPKNPRHLDHSSGMGESVDVDETSFLRWLIQDTLKSLSAYAACEGPCVHSLGLTMYPRSETIWYKYLMLPQFFVALCGGYCVEQLFVEAYLYLSNLKEIVGPPPQQVRNDINKVYQDGFLCFFKELRSRTRHGCMFVFFIRVFYFVSMIYLSLIGMMLHQVKTNKMKKYTSKNTCGYSELFKHFIVLCGMYVLLFFARWNSYMRLKIREGDSAEVQTAFGMDLHLWKAESTKLDREFRFLFQSFFSHLNSKGFRTEEFPEADACSLSMTSLTETFVAIMWRRTSTEEIIVSEQTSSTNKNAVNLPPHYETSLSSLTMENQPTAANMFGSPAFSNRPHQEKTHKSRRRTLQMTRKY